MRRQAVVIVAALVCTMVTACSHGSDATAPTTTRRKALPEGAVRVSSGRASSLPLPGGGSIEVPKGAVRGSGTLQVEPATASAAPTLPGVVSSGSPMDITLTGAELTGGLVVSVPMAADVGAFATQAAYDPSTRTWEVEPGVYDAKRGLLVTPIEHLSIRDWFHLDLSWAKEYVKKLLLGKYGDQLADVPPVTCPDQDWPPSEGWKVTSSSDKRITWCFDRTGDSRSLRIRDGARYAVMASGPDGLGYSRGVLPVSIGSIFVKFEEALNSTTNRTYSIIRRREDLVIDLSKLSPGSTTNIRLESNVTATLTDFLEIDVDLATTLLSKVPDAFLPKALERLKDPKVLLESASLVQCVLGSFNASDLTLDAQRSSNPIDIAAKASRCLLTEIKATAGIAGFIVAALISVLSLPGDIVGTLIAGGSIVFGDLGTYKIRVTAPSPDGDVDALPTIPIDQGNVAQYEALLRRLGLDTLDDNEAACTNIEVLGVDFATDSADIKYSHIVPGERGYDCDGDSAGSLTHYRNGHQVGEPASACGDCEEGFIDDTDYQAFLDAYTGRSVPSISPWVQDGVWSIWSYENYLIR